MAEEILTSLEMTSPEQLRDARPPPEPIELEEAGPADAELCRETWLRIGEPYAWHGRADWSDRRWEKHLSQSGVQAWIARIRDDLAGLVILETNPGGDVGIDMFGLVPEYVGRGFGGALLTMATRLAWAMTSPDGVPAKCVWVQTSSIDHPHAIRNYEARGFRAFKTERKTVAATSRDPFLSRGRLERSSPSRVKPAVDRSGPFEPR
jgi:GNAT superfamily N-acetyltransferase